MKLMSLSCVSRRQMRPCRQQTKKVMLTLSLTIYDSGVQCFFCFPEVLIISLHHNGGGRAKLAAGAATTESCIDEGSCGQKKVMEDTWTLDTCHAGPSQNL